MFGSIITTNNVTNYSTAVILDICFSLGVSNTETNRVQYLFIFGGLGWFPG